MRFINFILSITVFATIASALVLPVSYDLESRDVDLDVRDDLFDLEEFVGRDYDAYDLLERGDEFESDFNDIVFKREPAHVENTVQNHHHTTSAAGRGATHAIIQGGVHKSPKGGDQRDHVTVHYKHSDGTHLTTKHVHV